MPTSRWSATSRMSCGRERTRARSPRPPQTRCSTTTPNACTGCSFLPPTPTLPLKGGGAAFGDNMPPILDGIRVIDLSTGIAGPGSSMYLADQGANVIRIEAPKRGSEHSSSDDPALDAGSGFSVQNRSKRSITLDLKQPEGNAIFNELVQRSDVLITNMRQGAAA